MRNDTCNFNVQEKSERKMAGQYGRYSNDTVLPFRRTISKQIYIYECENEKKYAKHHKNNEKGKLNRHKNIEQPSWEQFEMFGTKLKRFLDLVLADLFQFSFHQTISSSIIVCIVTI